MEWEEELLVSSRQRPGKLVQYPERLFTTKNYLVQVVNNTVVLWTAWSCGQGRIACAKVPKEEECVAYGDRAQAAW
jgi:hypothetical protein